MPKGKSTKIPTKPSLILGGILLVTIIAIFVWWSFSQPKYLKDSDFLYDTAVQYLLDQDNSPEQSNNDYQRFADYEGFGITQDNDYKYAYMWIFDMSFYVNDKDQIQIGTGGSMPYKFYFNRDTNAVIKYEIPKDGTAYGPSIKEMFPRKVARKILKVNNFDDTKLMSEVKSYYSYLPDAEIYYGIDK